MWQNIIFDASISATGRYPLQPGARKDPVNDLRDEVKATDTDPSVFYQPLDPQEVQTRILTLYPGSATETLHCAIETVSLDAPTRDDYEALSYCWGDTTDKNIIHIKSTGSANGSDDEFRPFRVHNSLYIALLHLRPSSGPPRKLWADAICINQDDYAERAQQVTTMPQIYHHAKRVVIWLGPITPRRQLCVAKIQEIQGNLDRLSQVSRVYTDVEWLQLVREAAKTVASDREDAQWFLQQWAECDFDWFTRTWVLQEVANSRDRIVLCGNEELSWDTLCSLVRRIHLAKQEGSWTIFLTPSIMPPPFLNLVNDVRTPGRTTTDPATRQGILETIIAAHVMKATDARDKLFAMLQFGEDTSVHVGMDLNLQDPRIRPDYRKDSTTVFCDFVRWWIDKHKSLRILSAVHTLRHRGWQQTYCGKPLDIHELPYPTWSLNLSYGGDSDGAQATLGLGVDTGYNASASTQPSIFASSPEDNHILKIAGHRICRIQEIEPFPFWEPCDPRTAWLELRKVFGQIFDPTASRTPNDLGGIFKQNKPKDSKRERIREFEARHFTCHRRGFYQGSQRTLPCISPCYFVAEGPLHETSSRRGLCPHNARPGDIVVMLFGGAALYLLRPKSKEPDSAHAGEMGVQQLDSQQHYFVGECYLHEYMNGRALEEANAVGRAPETFNLV